MNKTIEYYWKKRFNESALNFENDADIGIWSKHGFERRFVSFFQFFQENYFTDDANGKKLLDIGCGSGAYTRKLADMDYNVLGLDYSEHTIKRAVEKSNNKNISYIIGSLPYLPFKEKSFDIVICIGVFQTLDEYSAAIIDITKLLKEDGGVLILITLNSLSLRMLYKKMFDLFPHSENLEKEIISMKRYNPFNLKKIIGNECFGDIKIIPIHIFPKMLIGFEKKGIFRVLDKLPIVSLLIAHAFIISAVRIKE